MPVKRLLKYLAMEHGLATDLYLRVCQPGNTEYTEYLRKQNRLHAIGKNCMINNDTVITNPAFVRLGNNVCLSTCTLLGHDGVVAVLNRAYDVKLDSVGKIDIKDNVFVGMHAIIMPDVTIGPNAVVAAGAVVTNDVAEGDIVGGIPARPIGKVENLVNKLEKETRKLPWANLIHQREGGYDPDLEPKLTRIRVEYFFNSR